MSTVPEAIVARQIGMQVLGVSLITNAAAGVLEEPINHADVLSMGERVSDQFCEFLVRVLARLPAS
jgi:purine-nucleoside phosphorylase